MDRKEKEEREGGGVMRQMLGPKIKANMIKRTHKKDVRRGCSEV